MNNDISNNNLKKNDELDSSNNSLYLQSGRNYKGKVDDDYIYYTYKQKRTLNDGTVRIYENKVRLKRNLKKKDEKNNNITKKYYYYKKKQVKMRAGRKKLAKNIISEIFVGLNDENKQKAMEFMTNLSNE